MVTVEEIYEAVRVELGDWGAEGPQFAPNTVLSPLLKSAWDEAMDAIRKRNVPRLKRIAFAYLPAYTNILTPDQFGRSDFDQPDFVEERGVAAQVAVTAASAASPSVLTAPAHPFSSNQLIQVLKVGAQVDGEWFITSVDADHFSLNGSHSTEAYTPVDGLALYSGEYFLPLSAPGELSRNSQNLDQRLYEYVYENGAFRFPGATSARELRITYFSTGVCPVTGDIGYHGMRNFLVNRIAEKMAGPAGQNSRVGYFRAKADEFLDSFIGEQVQQMQRTVYQPKRYRRRTN